MATEIAVESAIVYSGQGRSEKRLDLYLPADRRHAPVMVYLHGGAWVLGNRAETAQRFRALAAAGVAVASIDYTFIQDSCWPAQRADIVSAGNWLVRHGPQRGLIAGQVVLAGSSAGAHLAALAATELTDPANDASVRIAAEPPEFSVVAMVGYCGSYDLTSAAPRPDQRLPKPDLPVDDATLEYFGGRLPTSIELKGMLTGAAVDDVNDELMRGASPLYGVHDHLPPLVLVHGDRDALSALEQSEHMQQAARRVGRRAELIVVPGANHEGPELDSSDIAERVAAILRRDRSG